MRLSLAPRQDACQHVASNRKGRMAVEPVSPRNQAVAAAETVALVLDEDSPLPETTADVEDLARHLRGHINQLGVMVPKEEPALRRAQHDPATGRQLGNFPQAYSHIGVIGSALLLQQLDSGAPAAEADVLLAVAV
ncbi:DUF6415 family natural product biosynthesis protein [Streptomyces sp. NPDC002285]